MNEENINQETEELKHVSEEVTMQLEDGSKVTYQVDIIGDVDENTPVFLYNHGAGDVDIEFGYIDTAIENNNLNCDNVILVRYERKNNVFYSEGVEIVEDVLKTYDLSPSNAIFSGFSDGGQVAVKQNAEFCRRYEDVVNPKTVLIDAYYYNIVENEGMQVLADRGGIVYGLYNEGYVPGILEYSRTFASEGLHVIKIPDYYCKSGDFDRAHERCCYNLFNSGVFGYFVGQREFIDETFLDGNKQEHNFYSLPFKVDPTTGEWVSFDIRGMTEMEVYKLLGINVFLKLDYADKIDNIRLIQDISLGLLSEYIGIVTNKTYYVRSDSQLLEQRLNDIISKIRNSTIAQKLPDFFDFIESSSNVPKQIPSVVQGFFGISANLILSLNNDLQQFAKVGLSLQEIDDEFVNNVENL